MLRLEKKSRNRPISISLRMGNRLLTSTFVRSLVIAIGLHLLGFTLFKVSPFTIGNLETIFPPIQVNIDMGAPQEGGVLAQLEGSRVTPISIAEPRPSIPTIPPVPELHLLRNIAYPHQEAPKKNPFQQMEAEYLYLSRLDFSPSSPKKENPLEMKIYGPLAKKEILKKGWNESDIPHNLTSRQEAEGYLASYNVKVEDRTGKIFWHQHNNGPEKRKLHAVAEKILSNLRFSRSPHGCISEGRIEIMFSGVE